MRLSFYGAFLFALSLLLLSYGGRVSDFNAIGSSNTDPTAVGVIVKNVSSDDFDNALATITEVESDRFDAGRRPAAAAAGTKTSIRTPAL
jgi:hypothetical protein